MTAPSNKPAETAQPQWITEAKGAGSSTDDIDVYPGHRPPLWDRHTVVGALVFLLGAGATAQGFWLAAVEKSPLLPSALLFQAVGIAMMLRSVLQLFALAARLRLALAAKSHRLVLHPEGLLWSQPKGDLAIPREDLLDLGELDGDWGKRNRGRYSDIYLIFHPRLGIGRDGMALAALPPIFGESPGVLAEALMRWRGPIESADAPSAAEPVRLASKMYDQTTLGDVPAGVTLLRHNRSWARRGPYASLVMGIVAGFALLRMAESIAGVSAAVWAIGAIAICVLIPLRWLALTWREVAPRKGVALLLTPAEVIVRTRSGILRARWSSVENVVVLRQPNFSLLEGRSHTERLVFDRGEDQPPIRYDDAFLGVPAGAAKRLVEVYRRGLVREEP